MYKQINSILGVGSRRIAGNGNYDWIQMYPYSTPTNSSGTYPTTSVRIGATGYFEVRTTIGGSIGFSLEGFEFAGEMSGQDIYQSDTLYCESTYSLY